MIIEIELDKMPTDCYECPLQIKFKDGMQDDWYMRRCTVKNRVIEYPKPEWCPLKEHEAVESAEWLYGEKCGQDGYTCSKCGFFEPWYYDYVDGIDYIKDYDFCPSCGRKMTTYTGKPEQKGGQSK